MPPHLIDRFKILLNKIENKSKEIIKISGCFWNKNNICSLFTIFQEPLFYQNWSNFHKLLHSISFIGLSIYLPLFIYDLFIFLHIYFSIPSPFFHLISLSFYHFIFLSLYLYISWSLYSWSFYLLSISFW